MPHVLPLLLYNMMLASLISCGADPSPALLVKLISYPPGAYLQNATLLIALLSSSIDHCFSDWVLHSVSAALAHLKDFFL